MVDRTKALFILVGVFLVSGALHALETAPAAPPVSLFRAWLVAGDPPHYAIALAFIGLMTWEFWLGRTQLVRGNSTLELIGNALATGARRMVVRVVTVWVRRVSPSAAAAIEEADEADIAKTQVVQRPPPREPPGALLMLVVGAAMLLTACGHQPALRAELATIDTLDAAYDAYEKLDETQLNRCVDDSTSRPQYLACLACWRAKRAPAEVLADELHALLLVRAKVQAPDGGVSASFGTWAAAAAPLAAELVTEVEHLRAAGGGC